MAHVSKGRWIVGLVALAALGAFVYTRSRASAPVGVRVQARPIAQTVVVTGRVMTQSEVKLGSLVRGRVARVGAREGDRVEAGAVLVELEDAEARASLAEAEAQLARAQASLSRVVSHDALIAEQQLLRAETELATAEAQRARTAELIERGSLSRAELEKIDNTVARAREERARGKLALADARGGGEQQVASASVLEARARRDAAKARLDQHRLTAPAKGVVLARHVEAGDVVDGTRVLMIFALDGPTRLTVDPDERALGTLRLGLPARASTEAFPEEVFDARVDWIAPAVDEGRGTIEVRLLVERPPEYLRPDMTVSVTISAGARERALVIPRELVHDSTTEPWVFVSRDGKPERVSVELGLRSVRDVEVLRGLAEGDVVLP